MCSRPCWERADGRGAGSPDPLPAPSSRCPWLCCICCPKSACWPAALRGGPCCCPQTSSPWRHSLLRRKTCPRYPPSSTQVGALRNPRFKAPFQGSPAKPSRPEGVCGSQVVMAGKNPLALLVSGCGEGARDGANGPGGQESSSRLHPACVTSSMPPGLSPASNRPAKRTGAVLTSHRKVEKVGGRKWSPFCQGWARRGRRGN